MNKNPAPKQNRTHIVRARLNDDEYKRLMDWCKALEKTPSYMIRSALTSAAIHPVVYVNGINEQTLTLLNNLITEGKRIGNNINQIAKLAHMTGEVNAARYDIYVKMLEDAIVDITKAVLMPERIDDGDNVNVEG